MLSLNRDRVGAQNVDYVLADILSWSRDRRYDLVFFAFWLSHVPKARFEAFWHLVRESVVPGGHFFFIDELSNKLAQEFETKLGSGIVRRTLDDGRVFRAVKVYYRPIQLERKVSDLGWNARVESCGRYFYSGCGEARPS